MNPSHMQRTKRIVERLPEFYRAWDSQSVVYKLVDAIGRALNEEQKEAFSVLKTHWIDTAVGEDVDRLGGLFQLKREPLEDDDAYRYRIKKTIERYEGGGTRKAILSYLGTLLNTKEGEIQLIENPSTRITLETDLASGEKWEVGSMSIEDSTPSIEMEVREPGETILDPSLTNLATGESVKFNGVLSSQKILRIEPTSARLEGEDVSENVEATPFPELLRSGSEWKFGDALSSKIARFDSSSFDESIYEKSIPRVSIRFSWEGRAPSTFEVLIPSEALQRSGYTIEEIAVRLDLIKGAGIASRVRLKEQEEGV